MRWAFFLWILFSCFPLLSQETIAIVTTDNGIGSWDLDSIQSGITGSEEAVIYVSQELVKLGYQVFIYAPFPPGSRHSLPEANPRFVGPDFDRGVPFDIAISWRMPRLGKYLKTRAHKVYFWPHDLCSENYSEDELNAFDGVLWLSKSQRQQWSSYNPCLAKFKKIFGNGIIPEQFEALKERSNPYSCIYASSYDRGLEILLNIWPLVKREYPKATLDIYYGWRPSYALIYPQKQEKMKGQIASMAFLDVREHGLVGHEELTSAYEKASLWTYPCNALPVETFCISALRAQFAGAIPVVITGSALLETVQHGYQCFYPEEYLDTLLKAMEQAERISLQEREAQRAFILQNYTWETIAAKWKDYFTHSN